MTAVLVDVPCTRQLLESVPFGGRVVRDFGSGYKTILHRTGWDEWTYGRAKRTGMARPGVTARTVAILSGYTGHPVTVHMPGICHVGVTTGARFWVCFICADDKGGFDSIGAAADDARHHVANHIEIARAL